MVNAIANPHIPEIGERFLGTVVKLATFGAFVSLLPGKDGLLHVSELRKLTGKRVENVEDVLSVGQKIMVELVKIDDRGKLSLAPVVEGEAASADGNSRYRFAGAIQGHRSRWRYSARSVARLRDPTFCSRSQRAAVLRGRADVG